MANLIHSMISSRNRNIIFTHPDVTVAQCVETMTHDNIGALVVTDDINILGIVSERDIVRALVHKGLSPAATPVSAVMCAEVTFLKPTDTIEAAMKAITYTKRRHILIGEAGELMAIVSIGDLLFYILEEKNRQIEQLQNYIHT